eukprot:gnl/Trimastix_PCT/430.p1 GENE.gnl/Trimastix_PCT/430~~gnl/Trimastix_PCT/430.p1  ORF type:complete len:445 (+),score=34.02 gnl/Trimastix_PCT/430:925-2259(+)
MPIRNVTNRGQHVFERSFLRIMVSTHPGIALLSRCRGTCCCDICALPVEIQGEICSALSFSHFARLRQLSTCWNLRHQLFGPGKGVIAFGPNDYGQLGDGTTTCRLSPVELTGPVAALRPQQIAAGYDHTLALTSHGEVHAWGWRLGDGTMGYENQLVPVRVGGELAAKRVVQVECGSFHSLALTDQGEVYAWGLNDEGQLGDGTTDHRSLPVRVDLGGSLVIQISAGYRHSLALTSTGEVYGWGNSVQVACPSTQCLSPVTKHLPSDECNGRERVVRLVAGSRSSYALTDQGHLYAWGWNLYGQLGDGTTTNRRVPQRVPLPHRIVHVEASDHVLALTDQGEVYAWGSSLLGDGTTHIIRSPMQVGGPLAHRRVTQIAVGYYHSLAVTDQGEIFGWGWNEDGQLGDGTKEDRHTPHLLPCSSIIGRARNLRIAASHSTFLWAQ